MEQADIEEAGALLARAWLAAGDLAAMLPERLRPHSREEAYAIQDAMARIIEEPAAGWKMGATSPAISRREGHSGPIIGRVFASTLFHTPAEIPAARFPNARVEAEFAALLLDDLPARGRDYALEEVQGKVAIHPSIEIIGNRYPKGPAAPKLTTFDEIADNGTGSGIVLGERMEGWTGPGLQDLVIDLRVDGGAPAVNVLGDDRCVPLAVVVDTANILSRRGIGLCRGELISTGGITIPLPIGKGARFDARYGDFGTVTGSFV
jgi:2-keto-4-pentenoate hydratase